MHTTGAPSMRAGFRSYRWSFERGSNCGLKIQMIPSRWLMQSVLENPAFYGVKAHLFSPLYNMSRRQGPPKPLQTRVKRRFNGLKNGLEKEYGQQAE